MVIPSFDYVIAQAGSREYGEADRMVAAQYLKHFGSAHHHALPQILCQYADGKLTGCVGFAGASDGPLFLEQYLANPVEQDLQQSMGIKVPRARIVEIGGLACESRFHAFPLMLRLAAELAPRGYTIATGTLTAPVRRCLGKLDIGLTLLATAERERLAEEGDWGTYYDLEPAVVAGEVSAGLDAARRFGLLPAEVA